MSSQQDQKYELLISALRANQRCKKERQNFNLIKSSVSGQIEPSVSRNSAIDLLDCFNRVNNPAILKKEREEAINALRSGTNAEAAINAYVLAD